MRSDMSFKLAISSYSFHRFGQGPEGAERPSPAEMIEACAELRLDGFELLGRHLDSTAPEDLYALKRLAMENGIPIVAVSAHHNFVTPDPVRRRREIDV